VCTRATAHHLCSAHAAGSHAGKGWEAVTEAALRYVSATQPGVVFLLWGRPAQERAAVIEQKARHLVLRAAHPSPYSADKGFFGCRHFSQTNAFLVKHGLAPIDWHARD
jgi:uracil-DNA glycosylase